MMQLQQIESGLRFFECPITLEISADPVRIANHPINQQQYQVYDGNQIFNALKEKGICLLTRTPFTTVHLVPLRVELLAFLLLAQTHCILKVNQRSTDIRAIYSKQLSIVCEQLQKFFDSYPAERLNVLLQQATTLINRLANNQAVEIDLMMLTHLLSFGVSGDLAIQRQHLEQRLEMQLLMEGNFDQLSDTVREHLGIKFESLLMRFGLSYDPAKQAIFDSLFPHIIIHAAAHSRTHNKCLLHSLVDRLLSATETRAQFVFARCISLLLERGLVLSSNNLRVGSNESLMDSLGRRIILGRYTAYHSIYLACFKQSLEYGHKLSSPVSTQLFNQLLAQRTTLEAYLGLDYHHVALIGLCATETHQSLIKNLYRCCDTSGRDFIKKILTQTQHQDIDYFTTIQPDTIVSYNLELYTPFGRTHHRGQFDIKDLWRDAGKDQNFPLHNASFLHHISKLAAMQSDKEVDNHLLDLWISPGWHGDFLSKHHQLATEYKFGCWPKQTDAALWGQFDDMYDKMYKRKKDLLEALPALMEAFFTHKHFMWLGSVKASHLLGQLLVEHLFPNHDRLYTTAGIIKEWRLESLVKEIESILLSEVRSEVASDSILQKIKSIIKRFLYQLGLETRHTRPDHVSKMRKPLREYLCRAQLERVPEPLSSFRALYRQWSSRRKCRSTVHELLQVHEGVSAMRMT